MPGAELNTSAGDGPVVVAARGDLDMTGAAEAGAAITALVVPGRCLIIEMPAVDFIDGGSLAALLRVQRLARSTGADVMLAAPQRHVPHLLALAGRDHAFLIAAARGEHGMLRGAAPSRTGTGDRDRDGFPARLDAWMRQLAPGRAGAGGRACQLGADRAAGNREYKEA